MDQAFTSSKRYFSIIVSINLIMLMVLPIQIAKIIINQRGSLIYYYEDEIHNKFGGDDVTCVGDMRLCNLDK